MTPTDRKCAQRIAAPSVDPHPPSSSSKETFSPKIEPDASAETSWVVDSSGFLSPTGPVLKEVMDMVDGVGPVFPLSSSFF